DPRAHRGGARRPLLQRPQALAHLPRDRAQALTGGFPFRPRLLRPRRADPGPSAREALVTLHDGIVTFDSEAHTARSATLSLYARSDRGRQGTAGVATGRCWRPSRGTPPAQRSTKATRSALSIRRIVAGRRGPPCRTGSSSYSVSMSSHRTLPVNGASWCSSTTMLSRGGLSLVVIRATRALPRALLRALFETTTQGFSPWPISAQ